MDPNANLTRQRETLAEMREVSQRLELAEERGGDTHELEQEHAALLVELSELAEDLDDWLSKAGFLPDAWQHGPAVAARMVDEETTAVTIAGVDVYVRETPNDVSVCVGVDDLPPGKTARVEAFDGVSWEQELP